MTPRSESNGRRRTVSAVKTPAVQRIPYNDQVAYRVSVGSPAGVDLLNSAAVWAVTREL